MDQYTRIMRFADTYRFHTSPNSDRTVFTKGGHRIEVEWMYLSNKITSVYCAEYTTSISANPIASVTVGESGKGHHVEKWMTTAVLHNTGANDLAEARNVILQRRIHTMLGAHSSRGYLRIGEIRDLLVDRPGESNIRAALEALHGNNYVLYTSNTTQFAGWKLNPEGPTDIIMSNYDALRASASGKTQYDLITHAAKERLPTDTEVTHNNLTDTYTFGDQNIRIRYSADGVTVKEAEWASDNVYLDALNYSDRRKAERVIEWFDKATAAEKTKAKVRARVAELESADKQRTATRTNTEPTVPITAQSAFRAYKDLYEKLYASERPPLVNHVWDYLNAAANKEIAAELAERDAVIAELNERLEDIDALASRARAALELKEEHRTLANYRGILNMIYGEAEDISSRKIIGT